MEQFVEPDDNAKIRSQNLPSSFNGFTLLHVSDLHVDMSEGAMRRLMQLLPDLDYDMCVMTGDYRGATFGPYDAALEGMKRLQTRLREPVYAVLGNHDTIRMVPGLEEMGIRMLLNESEPISRGSDSIYLAGIDDAHYYRVDNIEKAASNIPHDGFSILLSHTPEVYRQATHAGFDLLLSGHTHGGQICLPGSIPITLDSVLPGTWDPEPGSTTIWLATRQWELARLSSQYGSIAFQKLRSITFNVAEQFPSIRAATNIEQHT